MYCRMLGCIPGICRDGSCHLPKMSQGLAKCPRLGRGVCRGEQNHFRLRPMLWTAVVLIRPISHLFSAVVGCSGHQLFTQSLALHPSLASLELISGTVGQPVPALPSLKCKIKAP